MSETKNLKLFKHDEPLSTNQNQFDIDKALHQNWDKIDEYVGANTQNIQTLQKQNTDLQQENVNLQEENNLLKSQIPNGQAVGENITLTDSSNLPYKKFNIGGKSVQETRSGKNLFDLKKLYVLNDNIQLNATGITLKNCWGNWVMTDNNVMKDIKPNTPYIFKAKVKCVSKPTTMPTSKNHNNILTLYNSSTGKNVGALYSASKNNWAVGEVHSLKCGFTTPEDLTGFKILGYTYYGNNDGSETYSGSGEFEITELMIVESTITDDSFELYGVSPSPEYPSEIKSVGDDVNLLDLKEIEDTAINEINFSVSNQQLKINGTGTSGKYSWVVFTQKGTFFKNGTPSANDISSWKGGTISKGIVTTSINIFAGTTTLTPTISLFDENGTNVTKAVTEDTNIVAVGLYLGNNQTFTDYTIGIKLQKGTKATAYSEYGKGTVEIKQKGKNVFDKNKSIIKTGVERIILPTGIRAKMTLEGVYQYLGIELGGSELLGKEITVGATITPSANNEGLINIRYGNSKGEVASSGILLEGVGTQSVTGKIANAFPDNCDRVYALLYGNKAGTGNVNDYVDYTDLMVVLGDTLGDYEEYKGNDYVLQISEPLRSLPNGVRDTREEDGIHRRVGSVVLDGSENWALALTGNNTNLYYIQMNYMTTEILSNYFTRNENLYNEDVEGIRGISSNNRLWIRSKEKTVDEFKVWLSTHNTEVLYELAEEIIEPYEDNPLKSATSYKNTTHIFSTDEVSPVFDITYKKDLGTLFNNLNSALVQGGV